jgi:hypothetical protein
MENLENLVYFKMVSGEEVIAKGKKIIGGWYMEDPALLIQMPDYKVGLASWIPYTTISHGANMPDHAILFVLDVSQDMIEYYLKWVDPNSEYIEIQDLDKDKQKQST